MSNEAKTYHLTVTLPDTTGEESDAIAGILQGSLDRLSVASERGYTVEYAPEFTTVYTLTFMVDWEVDTTVYTTRADLLARIAQDVAEMSEDTGEVGPVVTEETLREAVDFIIETGSEVQHYLIQTHIIRTNGGTK